MMIIRIIMQMMTRSWKVAIKIIMKMIIRLIVIMKIKKRRAAAKAVMII